MYSAPHVHRSSCVFNIRTRFVEASVKQTPEFTFKCFFLNKDVEHMSFLCMNNLKLNVSQGQSNNKSSSNQFLKCFGEGFQKGFQNTCHHFENKTDQKLLARKELRSSISLEWVRTLILLRRQTPDSLTQLQNCGSCLSHRYIGLTSASTNNTHGWLALACRQIRCVHRRQRLLLICCI